MPSPPCTHLRVNGSANRVGIDDSSIRFTWRLPADPPGATYERVEVRVAASPGDVIQGDNLVWDSGERRIEDGNAIAYGGDPVPPATRFFWSVRVWETGADTPADWAEPAYWETGIGADEDAWRDSAWIARAVRLPRKPQLHCALFRRPFDLPGQPVASARLYVATPGFFYAWVNGNQLADIPCDPIPSNSLERIYYRTFDVGDLLRPGRQMLGVRLASGYYSPSIHTSEHDVPVFRALLLVRFEDGETFRLGTDDAWKTTEDYIRLSHRYTKAAGFGTETWNMDDTVGPWTDPDYDDALWESAEPVSPPSGTLTGQPPVGHVIRARHTPISVERLRTDALLLDFGRVITGRIRGRFVLTQARINEVRLRYYDTWPRKNDFNQTDRYIAEPLWEKNRGVNVEWAPAFHLRCFRYVEVEYGGIEEAEDRWSFEVEEVGTLDKPIARFACNEPLLNRIHQTAVRTLQSLTINGVVTDCPHREKDGWGAECMANLDLLGSHFDCETFLHRFLLDCRDAQFDDGRMPYLIPWRHGKHVSLSGGPYYAGNPLECAWTGYLISGDRTFLSDNFDACYRWMEYTQGHMKDGILQPYFFGEGEGELSDFLKTRTQWFLGDWLSPGRKSDSLEENSLFNTAYIVFACNLLLDMARRLDRSGPVEQLQAWINASAAALLSRYIDTVTGVVGPGRQPYAVVVLLADFLEPDVHDRVYAELKRRIRQDDRMHFDTGVVATTWLLRLLMEKGDVDLALQLLLQTGKPSFGHFLEKGCTTFPEPWYDEQGGFGSSYCHASFSGVGFWFLQALAGIRPDRDGPGYRTVRLSPQFTPRLKHVEAEVRSPRGLIEASWRWLNADTLEYRVSLPPGSAGRLTLPQGYRGDDIPSEIPPGDHAGFTIHRAARIVNLPL